MIILRPSPDAKMLIASPATPMSLETKDAIRNMLAGISGICEAHIPLCFVMGLMEEPEQVLVLLIHSEHSTEEVVSKVSGRLSDILVSNESLKILPLPQFTPLAKNIRSVGCQLL